jgi:hypothetical protein
VFGDGINQRNVTILFILLALISIPLMLFPKPIILSKQHDKEVEHYHDQEVILSNVNFIRTRATNKMNKFGRHLMRKRKKTNSKRT